MTLPNGSAFYASVAAFCERHNVRPIGASPSFISDDVRGQIHVEWADFARITADCGITESQAHHNPGSMTTHRAAVLDGFDVVACTTVAS